MDLKSFINSTEVLAGCALIVAGLVAQALGLHGVLPTALAPFGVGLILCEVLTRTGRAARERVKIRIRKDNRRR